MKLKTRGSSIVVIMLIILSVISCKKTDQSAKIYGFVYNTAGVGIADVSVKTGSGAVFTNASGYYEMDDIDPGSASIEFSKSGYFNQIVNRSLNDGETYEVDMVLTLPGWTGTWFSGTFGVNFSVTGPSLGTQDQNTDFDYNGSNFYTPNRDDGIIDLGPVVDLDYIDHVPATGYQSSVTAFAGNAYAIRTTEGNYVKLRVNSLDSGDQAVYFDWNYQANGGTQF